MMELAPYNTLHQVLQMLLYYSTMHTDFRVILPDVCSMTLWGVIILVSSVGQLLSDEISFGSPPIQKSTIELAWMVSHECQEYCVLGRFVVV